MILVVNQFIFVLLLFPSEINTLIVRLECYMTFLLEEDKNELKMEDEGNEDRNEGNNITELDNNLRNIKVTWDKILRERSQILSKILPLMRSHMGNYLMNHYCIS